MAWTYLVELGESPTGSGNSESNQSPIARGTDTSAGSYLKTNSTISFRALRSGMTFGPLKVKCSHSYPTLYTVDSPARTSVLQEMERVWRESEADFSFRSCDSLAHADLDSFSWKTSQLSLFGGLTEFCWSSLRWGTMLGGRLYQPPRLEPHTLERGGGYLPTPRVYDAGVRGASWNANNPSLAETIHQTYWPTPKASDGTKGGPNAKYGRGNLQLPAAACRFPTPQARDWKDGLDPKPHGFHSPSVAVHVAADGHPGYLNPQFVEMLMGYPVGWSNLNRLGMPWSRRRSRKRSQKHSVFTANET